LKDNELLFLRCLFRNCLDIMVYCEWKSWKKYHQYFWSFLRWGNMSYAF